MTDRKRGGKASPIKDPFDVTLIYRRMVRRGYMKWAEVFLIGCNCGLRAGDLLGLRPENIHRWEHGGELLGRVYDQNLTEQKTSKRKELVINSAGMQAYERLRNCWPDDEYIAQSEGNRATYVKPVDLSHFNRVLRKISVELELNYRLSSHSMRKTFGYHAYQNAADKMDALLTLQKIYNHATPYETLEYIGITQDRVEDLYRTNLIGMGLGN